MSFEARARTAGDLAVLDLRGEVNRDAEQALEAAYAEAAASGPATVLLNFADVTYINSSGIAIIVGVLAKARGSGTEIRACGLTDHYTEIFEITRLADFVSIFPDEASAVQAAL